MEKILENKINDKKWLKEQYTKNRKTAKEIASVLGIGKTTVLRRLKEFNIKSNKKYVSRKFKNKEWLENSLKKYTIKKIASMCSVSPYLIGREIKKNNIKYNRVLTKTRLQQKKETGRKTKGRKHKESTKEKIRQAQIGKKGHNWKGGKKDGRFLYPWKKNRKKVLERDMYKCTKCNITKKENFEQELDVHHKVPFRFFINYKDAHTVNNLVTLCRKCHIIEEGKKEISNCKFGKNPIVWNFVNIFNSEFGDDVMIGTFVEIRGAKIGNNCRIQPFSFIPEGVTLEDNVFISPHVIFTNDTKPPSHGKKWKKTLVKKRAVIGAGAVILPGVTIGEGAMVGAGAVVTKDIPTYETWVGNPAKKIEKDI